VKPKIKGLMMISNVNYNMLPRVNTRQLGDSQYYYTFVYIEDYMSDDVRTHLIISDWSAAKKEEY